MRLLESILDDDTDFDKNITIQQAVDKWLMKSPQFDSRRPMKYELVGDTLVITNAPIFISHFNEFMKDTGVSKVKFLPSTTIAADILDGYSIECDAVLELHTRTIKNCILRASNGAVKIDAQDSKLTLSKVTIMSRSLELKNFKSLASLRSCNFDSVGCLWLVGVPDSVTNRLRDWGMYTPYRGNFDFAWTSLALKDIDANFDYIKDIQQNILGGARFKNLNSIKFTDALVSSHSALRLEKDRNRGQYDWGVNSLNDLKNGWQMFTSPDARI
jgi:hypothetical protein